MANVKAVIDVDINTSPAAAGLRSLQSQFNAFSQTLNTANASHARFAKENAQQLTSLVNATQFFTAETVKMRTAASQLDLTLAKGAGTMGQFFSAKFRKDGLAAAQVMSLANARASVMQTQFIATGQAANGMREAIAIRPLQAFNSAAVVSAQKLAIHRAMLNQATTSMINFGKNTQWAGRQLMVGFTVPLTIFAGVAGKAFRELEKEAINFRKVYGDIFTTDVEVEEALGNVRELTREFTKYGVQSQKTMQLAAIAAQAGKTGAELMAATTQATRLAVLGNMENEEAMRSTIALQSAFKMSNEELAESINFLNMVNNATVLSLRDVAESIPRVAPVIQGLGGDVKDLAVMLVAMREGGVSAAEAANGLKSSLGRLITPSKQAKDMAMSFGINLEDIVQKNAGNLLRTVTELAAAMKGLGDLETQQLLSTLFGKFQYARIGALFQNITEDGSQAQRAMEMMGMSAADAAAVAEKELGAIEQSVATKFTAAMERMRLAIAPIGEMFMKMAIPIVNFFAKIAEAFDKLPDFAKNFLALGAAIVGVVIPAGTMFAGLLMNLIGTLVKVGHLIGLAFKGFFSGGLAGAISNVSQALKYMSLEQIDATTSATQLAGATGAANKAFQNQIPAATSARAAIDQLGISYDIVYQKLRKIASANAMAFGPGAAAMRGAAAGSAAARGGTRFGRSSTPITPQGFNQGGSIPGVGNTDTVPAMLTPGEFVVNKKATRENLPILHAINDGQKLPGFNKGGKIPGVQYAMSGRLITTRQQLQDRAAALQGFRPEIPTRQSVRIGGISRSESVYQQLMAKNAQTSTKNARVVKFAVEQLGISPGELGLTSRGNFGFALTPESNIKMAKGTLTKQDLLADISNPASLNPLSDQLSRYFKMGIDRGKFLSILGDNINNLPTNLITNKRFEQASRKALYEYLRSERVPREQAGSFMKDILQKTEVSSGLRLERLEEALALRGITARRGGRKDFYVNYQGEELNLGRLLGQEIDSLSKPSDIIRFTRQRDSRSVVPRGFVFAHANKGGMIPDMQHLVRGGGVLSRAAQISRIKKADPLSAGIEDRSLRSIFRARFNDIKADTPSEFLAGMFGRWEKIPTRVSIKEDTRMLLKGKKPRYPAVSQEEYLADMIIAGNKFSDNVDAFKPVAFGKMPFTNETRVFDGHTRIHSMVVRGLIEKKLGRSITNMQKNELIDSIRSIRAMSARGEITDADVMRATSGQRVLTRAPMRTELERLFDHPLKQRPIQSMYNMQGRTLIPGVHDKEISAIVDAARKANFFGVKKDPESLMKSMGFVSLGDGSRYRYDPRVDFRNRSSYVNNMGRRIIDNLIDEKAILPLRRNKGGIIPRMSLGGVFAGLGRAVGLFSTRSGLPGLTRGREAMMQQFVDISASRGVSPQRGFSALNPKAGTSRPGRGTGTFVPDYPVARGHVAEAVRLLREGKETYHPGLMFWQGARANRQLISKDGISGQALLEDFFELERRGLYPPSLMLAGADRIKLNTVGIDEAYRSIKNELSKNATRMFREQDFTSLTERILRNNLDRSTFQTMYGIGTRRSAGKSVETLLYDDFIRRNAGGIIPGGEVTPSRGLYGIAPRAVQMLRSYMAGNYDMMRNADTRRTIMGLARPVSGTFFRGTQLGGGALPKRIERAMMQAEKTGDYSKLVGQRFRMRASDWSTDKNTALRFTQMNRAKEKKDFLLYEKSIAEKKLFRETDRVKSFEQGKTPWLSSKQVEESRKGMEFWAKDLARINAELEKIGELSPLVIQAKGSMRAVPASQLVPDATYLGRPIAENNIISAQGTYEIRRASRGNLELLPVQRRNLGGLIHGYNMGGDVQAFVNKKIFESARKTIVPGVGNTDTVPAALTPGEFVVNKQATQNNLPLLRAINSGKPLEMNIGGMVPRMLQRFAQPFRNMKKSFFAPEFRLAERSANFGDEASIMAYKRNIFGIKRPVAGLEMGKSGPTGKDGPWKIITLASKDRDKHLVPTILALAGKYGIKTTGSVPHSSANLSQHSVRVVERLVRKGIIPDPGIGRTQLNEITKSSANSMLRGMRENLRVGRRNMDDYQSVSSRVLSQQEVEESGLLLRNLLRRPNTVEIFTPTEQIKQSQLEIKRLEVALQRAMASGRTTSKEYGELGTRILAQIGRNRDLNPGNPADRALVDNASKTLDRMLTNSSSRFNQSRAMGLNSGGMIPGVQYFAAQMAQRVVQTASAAQKAEAGRRQYMAKFGDMWIAKPQSFNANKVSRMAGAPQARELYRGFNPMASRSMPKEIKDGYEIFLRTGDPSKLNALKGTKFSDINRSWSTNEGVATRYASRANNVGDTGAVAVLRDPDGVYGVNPGAIKGNLLSSSRSTNIASLDEVVLLGDPRKGFRASAPILEFQGLDNSGRLIFNVPSQLSKREIKKLSIRAKIQSQDPSSGFGSLPNWLVQQQRQRIIPKKAPAQDWDGLNKGGVAGFNTGNIVPGVGNTDTVPAMLTPGEFVINKEATQQNLGLLHAINSGKALGMNKGGIIPGIQHLNSGGVVQVDGKWYVDDGRNTRGPYRTQAAAERAYSRLTGRFGKMFGGRRGGFSSTSPSAGVGASGRGAGAGMMRGMGPSMGMAMGGMGVMMLGQRMEQQAMERGETSTMGAALSTGGIGLSMASILPFLPAAILKPLLTIGAPLAAIGGGLALFETHTNNAAMAAAEMAAGISGTIHPLKKMGELLGTATPAQRRAQINLGIGQEEVESFQQEFGEVFSTEQGMQFVDELKRASSPERFEKLSNYLRYAVASEMMDKESAKTFARVISSEIGDSFLGARVSSVLSKQDQGSVALLRLGLQRDLEAQRKASMQRFQLETEAGGGISLEDSASIIATSSLALQDFSNASALAFEELTSGQISVEQYQNVVDQSRQKQGEYTKALVDAIDKTGKLGSSMQVLKDQFMKMGFDESMFKEIEDNLFKASKEVKIDELAENSFENLGARLRTWVELPTLDRLNPFDSENWKNLTPGAKAARVQADELKTDVIPFVAAAVFEGMEPMLAQNIAIELLIDEGGITENFEKIAEKFGAKLAFESEIVMKRINDGELIDFSAGIERIADRAESIVTNRKEKVESIFDEFVQRGGSPDQFLTWIESIPEEKRFSFIVDFGGLSKREQQDYLSDASSFAQAFGQEFQLRLQQSEIYKNILGTQSTRQLREAISSASEAGVAETIIDFAFRESGENYNAEEIAQRINKLTESFMRVQTLPEEIIKTLRINVEVGEDLEKIGPYVEEIEALDELIDKSFDAVDKSLIFNFVLYNGEGEVKTFDEMARSIGNLNIAYQSLESLSPAVRKQAIIDIATALGEGDPDAIMERVMSDFPDFLQMEGSQQAFILEQYGQAFARTASAAKELQVVQEKIAETESKISEEQSKVSGADAKERVSQNYKEDLGLLRETEVALKKTTQGQLEFNAARAASVASGAGFRVPPELMGALGISYDSDQFKQDADKIATAWTIMQELPAEIDLNFVARFMVFGAGDEVLDADGVAKQGKKLRKAFEDLQSEDPQKRKEAQATIAFAYAIQVSQGVVDENGNQVSPEEISNRAFEELRAQFPDFDTLDIQTQGAMIRSRIDYIVEGAELAAQNAELEKNMATALAMGDGESARRIATKIEENNKKMGEISAKAAAVSETQYRTPSSAGGSSGGGQKSLGQQLAEQLKETQKMFNSLRNVTNNDAFKAFIAGPFAPEFLEYLRNQGEEGLKILQSGIKRIKQEYEKFKKIRMLEIGAQAIVAPFMRQEEIRSMQQQSNVAGILRSGRGFGMRGRGIDEEQLQYVMNAIPPDELATLAYLESKSKLNKQERQLLNSIRKNIREAISQAPEALAIQDAEAFTAGINQAEQSVQHFNNLVSRGIDPEMAQSMIEMGVTASMVSKSSAADIQKMAEDVKRVQIAENVQAITLSFAQMGQDIKGTMNIMSAIPNATQDTIDRLKSLGDMSLLTAEEIKHLNTQLMMMEAATDKARPALDRMSDQLETFVGSIEADIERINRLEIRPLELDINRIQKEMYPFQDEIKRLEKLIKPLNKEVDEFNEQIDRQQRLIRPLNKDIEKLREEEDELNKHYEERSKALDQVARANEKVIAQQKGQLDIASALSRGDIAGAARATRELQATMAQQRMDDAKAALEKEREDKRLEITKQIEAKEKEIKAINEGIEAIQEKIEQRQDAINEYSKLIAIENDKIADKQEEIEGIQRRIEQSKEKQLALEEKIYKAQLLQSMVSTQRQIAEDARLGRTEAVQFGINQLRSQMAIAGGTSEEREKFFEGLPGGPEAIKDAQQMAAKTPQQLVAELMFNVEDLTNTLVENLRTKLIGELGKNLEELHPEIAAILNATRDSSGQFINEETGLPYTTNEILGAMERADLTLSDFLGKGRNIGKLGENVDEIVRATRRTANNFLELPGLAVAARKSFEAIVRALDGKIAAANAAASAARAAADEARNARPQAKMYGGFIKRAFGGMISYKGSTEPAPGMAMGGKMKKYASGSFVPGIGITDSVPALLTPGEFVVRKSVAQAYGPMLQSLNSQIYPEMQRFAMGGFASGMGSMTRSASSSMLPSLTNVTRIRAFPTMAGRTQQIRVGASRGTAAAGMSNIEYNYNVNVNAQTDASADDIANAVIYKVRRMEARQVRGTRIG